MKTLSILFAVILSTTTGYADTLDKANCCPQLKKDVKIWIAKHLYLDRMRYDFSKTSEIKASFDVGHGVNPKIIINFEVRF